jgi:hypothetical protein
MNIVNLIITLTRDIVHLSPLLCFEKLINYWSHDKRKTRHLYLGEMIRSDAALLSKPTHYFFSINKKYIR